MMFVSVSHINGIHCMSCDICVVYKTYHNGLDIDYTGGLCVHIYDIQLIIYVTVDNK